MKKSYRVVSMLCAICMFFVSLPLLTSCGSKKCDLRIYNAKGEVAKQFEEIAELYKKETGKNVEVRSVQSGQSAMDLIRTAMDSEEPPTLFTVQSLMEASEFINSEKALKLTDGDSEFSKFVKQIPEDIRLSEYTYPVNIEGLGWVVNEKVLGEYIGKDKVKSFMQDFTKATYPEWEAFVSVAQSNIKNNTPGTFTLNGNKYDLPGEKNETTKKLEGVFSVAGNDSWTYGNHLINIALNTRFSNQKEAMAAKKEQISPLFNSFKAYAKLLDLISSNADLPRNKDFINQKYDAAVINFAQGKSLFIKQGNWVLDKIREAVPDDTEIEKNLAILPVKLDVKQEDISVDGLTVEKLNSSATVFVSWYWIINAAANKDQVECAKDFLLWLYKKEGRTHLLSKLKYIPCDIKSEEKSKFTDGMSKSILDYKVSGNTIGNPFVGFGDAWTQKTAGAYMKENWLNKSKWNVPADYDTIAKYLVESLEKHVSKTTG